MAEGKTRNWWKVAFLVSLLLLEIAREWIVVTASPEAKPLVSEFTFSSDGFTSVEGRWIRTDGGDQLVPQGTTIECYRSRGECIEAEYTVSGLYVFAPTISIWNADFGPDSITFADDSSLCVRYDTRIDLASKEVYRVRQKKPTAEAAFEDAPELDEACANLEDRIEMQIAGWDHKLLRDDMLEGHFLPVLSTMVFVFGG